MKDSIGFRIKVYESIKLQSMTFEPFSNAIHNPSTQNVISPTS